MLQISSSQLCGRVESAVGRVRVSMWWCTLQQFGSTAARSGVLLALVVSLPCADHHRPTPAKTTSSSPRSAGKPQWAPPVTLRTARPNPRFAKGAQQDLSRVKARFLCCRQSIFVWFFGIWFGQMGQISGQGNFTHIRQGSFFAVCIWQGAEFKGILCTPVRFLWESE